MLSVLGIQAVERQQRPAAQLLVHRMMPVADRGLGHLGNQGLRVTQQQQQVHLAVAMELVPELLPQQSERVAGALLHDIQERDAGVRRKLDVAQSVAGLVENRIEWQFDQLQMRKQPLALGQRQRVQNVILLSAGPSSLLVVPRWARDALRKFRLIARRMYDGALRRHDVQPLAHSIPDIISPRIAPGHAGAEDALCRLAHGRDPGFGAAWGSQGYMIGLRIDSSSVPS
jgi:hypothetical protein